MLSSRDVATTRSSSSPTKAALLALALISLSITTSAAAETTPDDAADFFERKVRPVLVQHCYSCHAKGQSKGELSLANRTGLLAGGESGAVVSLEKPDESLLIAAIEGRDGLQMPPNEKLSAAEIDVLRRWVQIGVPWPEPKTTPAGNGVRPPGELAPEDRQFWSFLPVRDIAPPAVQNNSWPRRPLDRFVMAELEANGLSPVEEADKRTYIRRATFDLLGLPPTPDEVAAFLADDSPLAHERLVDRLLDSPHAGERWARHWLDVARYGEDQAHTFEARTYPNGYRYRDWVVDAFSADMPYDEFIVEQIAGDLLPESKADKERLAALGFLALGPVYYKGGGCAGKAESDELDDRVDTLSRAFLGLTVSCARCHDHKFDPIPTKDYYALAGVFASTQYREAPLVADDIAQRYDGAADAIKQQEKRLTESRTTAARELGESFVPLTARYIAAAWKLQHRGDRPAEAFAEQLASEQGLQRFLIERWSSFLTSDLVQKRDYLDSYRQILAAQKSGAGPAEAPETFAAVERFGRELEERLAAALKTRGEVDRLRAERQAATAEPDKKKPDEPKLDPAVAELLKDLLTDKTAPLALPKDQVDKLLSAETKTALATQQSDLDRSKRELGPKYPFAHSLEEGAATNLKVHLRGNHKELGDEVPRHFLSVLSPEAPPPFRDGSGRLELARAIADRSNPLTARVMVNRVWLNLFGRGLVGTPSNFGLLGERPTNPLLLDHLAARFMTSGWSLKGLHREILLSATYRLGSSATSAANPAQTIDPDNRLHWRQNRRRLDIEAWRDAMLAVSGSLQGTIGGPSTSLADAGNRRRTLYAAISRHQLNDTLRLFDFPDPSLTSERRVSTTVPMQQLFVLNSDFVVQQARTLASRLDAGSGAENTPPDDSARIDRAYALLFQRAPTQRERQIGLAYLAAPVPDAPPASPVKLTALQRYAQALLGTNEFAFLD